MTGRAKFEWYGNLGIIKLQVRSYQISLVPYAKCVNLLLLLGGTRINENHLEGLCQEKTERLLPDYQRTQRLKPQKEMVLLAWAGN